MPTLPSSQSPGPEQGQLKPGDEAQAGTPGTGEDLCEDCGGRGKLNDGSRCPTCEGSGHVIRGIGGG